MKKRNCGKKAEQRKKCGKNAEKGQKSGIFPQKAERLATLDGTTKNCPARPAGTNPTSASRPVPSHLKSFRSRPVPRLAEFFPSRPA